MRIGNPDVSLIGLLVVVLLLTAVLALIVISAIFMVRRPEAAEVHDQGAAVKVGPEDAQDIARNED
ncbi:hypothetical protein PQR34_47420 [Paraburkholderia sediminicola]|uniref:hypothetical protein n=1 Tax=Paraburkholderia sediminicola TaxID=458836 RepID=UPI0038BA3526